MKTFECRNVNDAFRKVVDFFHQKSTEGYDVRREKSRNGDVLRVNGPACISYGLPQERVLFNVNRDCNPFFHVYEALWMLGGREDLKSLEYYVSSFGDYSDDGETLNGAYGNRWRYAKIADVHNIGGEPLRDQLKLLIDHFKKDPATRRAVLQMWNVEDDLLQVNDSKDVCCNLSAVFEIEELSFVSPEGTTHNASLLNMTVFNRSNDAVWGALGANVVHFSFLQEYLAAWLGAGVGKYYQISSNLHVYLDKFEPLKWLGTGHRTMHDAVEPIYGLGDQPMKIVPLVRDPMLFDEELNWFLNNNETPVTEPFLLHVAQPMATAYRHHKERDYGKANEAMQRVMSDDWRWAGIQWLQRRERSWLKAQKK